MQYPNLRVAFQVLSNRDLHGGAGAMACDAIAKLISQRGEAYAASLDKQISFWNLRSASAETVAYRRLAMLLERIGPSGDERASSWDQNELEAYVRARLGTPLTVPACAGYYFKGSFWCFASKNEFTWLKSAWDEAGLLLEAGLRTANRASLSTDCTNLIARWFGRGEGTVMQVANAFQRMLEARKDAAQYIGMCYVGPNASRNTGAMPYHEYLSENSPSQVLPNDKEHGWASPPGPLGKNMGLCNKFFSKSRIGVTNLADFTSLALGNSRGGAVVHEYAHLILNANDETIRPSDGGGLYDAFFGDVIKTIGQTAEDHGRTAKQRGTAHDVHEKLVKQQTNQKRIAVYSPLLCRGLARTYSQGALTNADNYRLFSEDALYYEPWK